MKNFLKTLFIIAYSLIAIIVTVLLLSYNSYMCSYIGGYTVYMLEDDIADSDFVSGDLLLIKYSKPSNVKVGDQIFLYRTLSTTEYEVVLGDVTEVVESGLSYIYVVDEEGYQYDSNYLIGKAEDTISIAHLGTVLTILESRWGYLFCIVIVTLLLLLQEILDLIEEIRYGKEVAKEEENAVPVNEVQYQNNMQQPQYQPQYQAPNTIEKMKQFQSGATNEPMKHKTKKTSKGTTEEKVKKHKKTSDESVTKKHKKSTLDE